MSLYAANETALERLERYAHLYCVAMLPYPSGRNLLEAHLWLYRDQHLADEQVDSLEHTAASTPDGSQSQPDRSRPDKFEDAKVRRETARRLQREHYGHDMGIQEIAYIFPAEIAFEAGETDALALMQALCFANTREGWSEVYLAGYEIAFALILQDGGYEQATDILANAEAMIFRRDLPRFSRQIRILEFDLAVSAGQKTEAKRLAARVRHLLKAVDGNESLRWRGRHLAILALSHFETRFGNAALANDMLTALADECRDAGLYRYLARASALFTINAAARKDKDAAAQALHSTIRLSQDGQFPGTHLRSGQEFAEAARWTIRECGVSTLNKSAISALTRILWLLNPDRRNKADFFSDMLTSKEREVFTLLADGPATLNSARRQ